MENLSCSYLATLPPAERQARLHADRQRHGEAVIIVGVLADEIDAAGGADGEPGLASEGGREAGEETVMQIGHAGFSSGLAARRRSAACSGVRSRCASASIS